MKRAAICLAVLVALSACQSPEQKAKERLQQQVAGVRDAVEDRDAQTAAQRLASLRADVAKMRQENLITEQQTQQILTAALQVQTNLMWLAPAAAPAPPPPPPPVPAPAPTQQLEPPSSNAGGSIRGADGQPGDRGKKGEDGKGADKNEDGGREDKEDD